MEPVDSTRDSSSQNSLSENSQRKGKKHLGTSLSNFFRKFHSPDTISNRSLSSNRTTSISIRGNSISKKSHDLEHGSQSRSILDFAVNYPLCTTLDMHSPKVRRSSQEEIKEAALLELRHRVADKINQDTTTLIKKRLSQSSFEAMGKSVNHVFPIDKEAIEAGGVSIKEKIAYLKCSRDGKANSSIMEKTASNIAKELDLNNFVESSIMHISPRSGEQLVINNSYPSKRQSSGKPEKLKRASSLTEEFLNSDGMPFLRVTVSKPIRGMTIEKIYNERKDLEAGVLFNKLQSLKPCTREEYRLLFIEGVLNSIIIGTSDAHGGNIILSDSGFFHLDQGRSLSNSNMLLIWGDSFKLPYYSAFVMEKDFFLNLSEKEAEFISEFIKRVQKKAKKLESFFFHPIQQSNDGMDNLPAGWIYKKSTCQAIIDRINKVEKWINKKNTMKLRKKKKFGSLDDLIQSVYPYQSLVTCLYATTKVIPFLFLSKSSNEKTSDTEGAIEKIWELATEHAGKFQNHPDPLSGNIHDLFHLLDQFGEVVLNPDQILKNVFSKELKSSATGKETLKVIYDQISEKLDACKKAGLLNDEINFDHPGESQLFRKLELYNGLRNNMDENRLYSIIIEMVKAGYAPKNVLDHLTNLKCTKETADWVLKIISHDYLKTLFSILDTNQDKSIYEQLKAIKLILAKDARIDFKEVSDNEYWLIQYLNRLCNIAGTPCLSSDILLPFSIEDGEDFISKAFLKLDEIYSKGYCLSFFKLEKRQRTSNVFEIGCSVAFLNAEGVLLRNKEQLIVTVIEGEIFVVVSRDNSNKHLVPFQEFLREIDDCYRADRKFNREHLDNILHAKQLFPIEYFKFELLKEKIEFFNFDEFEITPEFFNEINNFILFFKRFYILKKEDNLSLMFLDDKGKENCVPLELETEFLFVRYQNDTYDPIDFVSFLKEKMTQNAFRYGNYLITIGENEKFTIKKDDLTIQGKFDPGAMEIVLDIVNKEVLSLEEFKSFLET